MVYLTFNTGFQYNFNEDIEDITLFCGYGNLSEGTWRWTAIDDIHIIDDPVTILFKLNEFEDNGCVLPKFYKYSYDLEGTQEIVEYETFGVDRQFSLEQISKCRLACLIYHQLLYKSNLQVKF